MQTLAGIAETRAAVAAARARGTRVGFVPTMGFLHDGHLSLVDAARARSGFVVMSIFVNPLQFGPSEDLAHYPRDPAGDAAKARARGVDVLFVPEAADMYGPVRSVSVTPRGLHARWEGEARPGHFAGVLTVVAKLFNIVQPDVVVFGQKDFQQAALVRAMIRDLDFPLEMHTAPTVREPDGLAMSSRNSYLHGDDRVRARSLSAALRAMQGAFAAGERGREPLEQVGRAVLEAAGSLQVDYLAVVDPRTLEPAAAPDPASVAIVAARVGPTRLIDNAPLGASLP